MKKRYGMMGLVLILIFIGLWLTRQEDYPPVKEGAVAPDFTLLNRSSQKISLSDLRGKVVLVNFWATWCGPCVSEMESLEKLHQHFQGQAFEVVAISLDEEGWKAIDLFLKKIPVTFIILLDSDFSIANQYGTYRLPESYLIDQNGKIVEKILGAQDWMEQRIVKKIEKILGRGVLQYAPTKTIGQGS